ncbi:hypothetical protein CMI38_00875 [Candidatus Pacearchaeota archaeon]|jgi:DNA-directed RNA polymerase subunit D|nr:hypothetical protein [Candidatus Pacearchaeota archaeon]|tara:strand:+ start:1391 stop:2053 length:663 start_codon:yes stop_codon:yes gene_type:complete
MIKIQNNDKERGKLSFVSDMSVSVANAIRRSVVEIPIMAIDEVEITKNDSALYDEMLAHRIGLIPVETKGNKEVKFALKEKGPKIVYSSDMKPSTGVDLKIPIVILDKEQEVELVGEARLGKGVEHVKHSPGLVYYKHDLDDEILDFVRVDEEGKIVIDEEDLVNKGLSEDKIKNIKSVKEINNIVFSIESWGQIDVREIFVGAVDVLQGNLKELDKGVK